MLHYYYYLSLRLSSDMLHYYYYLSLRLSSDMLHTHNIHTHNYMTSRHSVETRIGFSRFSENPSMRGQTYGGNQCPAARVLSQSGEIHGLFVVDLNFKFILTSSDVQTKDYEKKFKVH